MNAALQQSQPWERPRNTCLIGLDDNLQPDDWYDDAPANDFVSSEVGGLKPGSVSDVGPPPGSRNDEACDTPHAQAPENTINGDDDTTSAKRAEPANESHAADLSLVEAAHAYVDLGLHLVPIPYGKKGPDTLGWNKPENLISTHSQVEARLGDGVLQNIGLQHQASGTCAIDIDDVEHAKLIFTELGLDYDSIMGSGLRMWSGRDNRDKVIFRAPDLPMTQVNWPKPGANKATEVVTIFELRAGPSHDVLPPSIHPDGHAYIWQPGRAPWEVKEIPELPAELVQFWKALHDRSTGLHNDIQRMCPWKTGAASPPTRMARAPVGQGQDVIGKFNAANSVEELLQNYGYKKRGKRYLAPSSSTGIPAVVILEGGKCYSHHGSDVLSDGHAHDAFDVFCLVEHGGDSKSAVKAAALELGIDRSAPVEPLADSEIDALLAGSNAKKGQAGVGGAGEDDEGLSGLSLAPVFNYGMVPGILGDFIRSETEFSEAPEIGVLNNLLTRLSADIGRTAYFEVGHKKMHIRMNILSAGPSALGRKGTSAGIASALRDRAFSLQTETPGELPTKDWKAAMLANAQSMRPARTITALNTGEGLIGQLRTTATPEHKEQVDPPGLNDNRLLIDAQEFSAVLKKASAKEATLSATLRELWDGETLSNSSLTNAMQADRPHGVVNASVPSTELVKLLTGEGAGEASNGLMNRFVITNQVRGKVLARPAKGSPWVFDRMAQAYMLALGTAWGHYSRYEVGEDSTIELTMSDEAKAAYESWYEDDTRRVDSVLIKNLLNRSSAYLLMYAALLALLRGSKVTEAQDIEAGKLFLDYWRASLEFIFSQGQQTAQELKMASDTEKMLSRLPIGVAVKMSSLKDFGTAKERKPLLDWGMRQSPPWLLIQRQDATKKGGRPSELVTRLV